MSGMSGVNDAPEGDGADDECDHEHHYQRIILGPFGQEDVGVPIGELVQRQLNARHLTIHFDIERRKGLGWHVEECRYKSMNIRESFTSVAAAILHGYLYSQREFLRSEEIDPSHFRIIVWTVEDRENEPEFPKGDHPGYNYSNATYIRQGEAFQLGDLPDPDFSNRSEERRV